MQEHRKSEITHLIDINYEVPDHEGSWGWRLVEYIGGHNEASWSLPAMAIKKITYHIDDSCSSLKKSSTETSKKTYVVDEYPRSHFKLALHSSSIVRYFVKKMQSECWKASENCTQMTIFSNIPRAMTKLTVPKFKPLFNHIQFNLLLFVLQGWWRKIIKTTQGTRF